MQNKRIILIAEPNPKIRKRVFCELAAEDYSVFAVENADQLKNWICLRRAPDILVLDPALPSSEENDIWDLLANFPLLPVIIHDRCANGWRNKLRLIQSVLVEKNRHSIIILKQRVNRIGNENDPGN